ncbi:MAG: BMP family ABC transporter substrate-binding protein [Lachnospiraceae bacterium]|nr:BMP family ABC transporter substrate-binding protein [Lachnospiraceae bacterium]
MLEDYQSAKKLGEAAAKAAIKEGKSPYLPVLDAIPEIKDSVGEAYVGVLELPVSYIVGNKEMSRNNAFACNFMPLLEEGTEFATKWSNLCESVRNEGVHTGIKCYEYMNNYYVQEGNKRVSVSNFLKMGFIHSEVTRILPPKGDTKELKVYYEYLDFFNVTRAFYITFSEPGGYAKLAELLGQDLENKWSEESLQDLKAAYFLFEKLYRSIIKESDRYVVSDAFLLYLSVFPVKSLFEDTEDQIIKNIKMARLELRTNTKVEDIEFLTDAPPAEKKAANILEIFNRSKNYTSANPLKVGFIYDEDMNDSRWVESHEAGRLYALEIIGNRVRSATYQANPDGSDVNEVIQKAIDDKNELIFTVSSKMASNTLQLAIANPGVKFLNCSIGQPHPSFRCYHGKLYEATFLTGILAANLMLTQAEPIADRRIGYLVHSLHSRTYANLNAFAIGVSLVDPLCKVSLKYTGGGEHDHYRDEWIDEGVLFYADLEYSATHGARYKSGLFQINKNVSTEGLSENRPGTGNQDYFIGAPYILWGKFYSMMIQSVLSGAWDLNEQAKTSSPTNYWFGLSTGVVGLRAPNLPYQTEKMMAFFKNAMVYGGMDPFSGEIHSQTEVIHEGSMGKALKLPHELKKMTAGQIIEMDWLNENIEGDIPVYRRTL